MHLAAEESLGQGSRTEPVTTLRCEANKGRRVSRRKVEGVVWQTRVSVERTGREESCFLLDGYDEASSKAVTDGHETGQR